MKSKQQARKLDKSYVRLLVGSCVGAVSLVTMWMIFLFSDHVLYSKTIEWDDTSSSVVVSSHLEARFFLMILLGLVPIISFILAWSNCYNKWLDKVIVTALFASFASMLIIIVPQAVNSEFGHTSKVRDLACENLHPGSTYKDTSNENVNMSCELSSQMKDGVLVSETVEYYMIGDRKNNSKIVFTPYMPVQAETK